MTPEQIKQLRGDLRCTARELANTLGIPLAEIQSWESGELFPTKRRVAELQALRIKGPDAVLRKVSKSKPGPVTALAQLENPELWLLVRKLVAHPQLLAKAIELAAPYDDPAAVSPK